MKQHVVIFEARGGSDKGEYGYRPDSKPIIDSLSERGWTSEIVFYRDEDRGEIYRHTLERAGAYVPGKEDHSRPLVRVPRCPLPSVAPARGPFAGLAPRGDLGCCSSTGDSGVGSFSLGLPELGRAGVERTCL